jgi:hypothetical protein
LRRRASSSRSTLVTPVRPCDRSARARFTHSRRAVSVRSRSPATAGTDLPSSKTRRTAPGYRDYSFLEPNPVSGNTWVATSASPPTWIACAATWRRSASARVQRGLLDLSGVLAPRHSACYDRLTRGAPADSIAELAKTTISGAGILPYSHLLF